MDTVQSIFREYGPDYAEQFCGRMPADHLKVIEAIMNCRTPVFGMTVYECSECGNTHFIPRSCGNRHCPSCQHRKGLEWMDVQVKRQVPTHHFMITFTVPEEIRPFIRSHQRISYNALFKASSETMKKLAGDEKYIGGDTPGFFGVLHTWGRTLNYHPHIHYVVAGGAWSKQDRERHPSRPDFYLPVKAMSQIYRAKFRELMKDAGMLPKIPPETWRKGWNVNVQAAGSAEQSVKYLAHYVFKTAISNHRIVKCENGKATFKYQKPGSRRTRFMTLPAFEFIRRFLQHVLPSGFMKVRHYGFMNACSGVPLGLVRAAAELMQGFDVKEPEINEADAEKPAPRCPDCGGKLIYCYSILPHQMTPPPSAGLMLKEQAVKLE
jgi:DNA-directed RNA polymerase subunit RPC12/RpoP